VMKEPAANRLRHPMSPFQLTSAFGSVSVDIRTKIFISFDYWFG
jgi:hypothetical protein